MSTPDFCQSFPYSASPSATILILGSMPGRRSLQEQQYYAHPQNIFWDIMGDLFGAGRQLPYKRRLQHLREKRIALWDVAYQCYRPGSLDSDIYERTVIPNNFKQFFELHPLVRNVFFNGQVSENLFSKFVLKSLSEIFDRLTFTRFPSTSPAHASVTRLEKLEQWRELKNRV